MLQKQSSDVNGAKISILTNHNKPVWSLTAILSAKNDTNLWAEDADSQPLDCCRKGGLDASI